MLWALLLVGCVETCAAATRPAAAPRTPFASSLVRVRESIAPAKQFFFPGHSSGRFALHNSDLDKLRTDAFYHDLPELDGLDNIHSPEGPLLESLGLAAELYGAQRSWFLVNGSTGGLLASILAFARAQRRKRGRVVDEAKGRRSVLLVTRDAHKAVFDSLWVAQCDALVLPCLVDETMGVSLGWGGEAFSAAIAQVEALLTGERGADICGMVLTRPTYQGVMLGSARLRALADVLHRFGVPLLVDEAHGGHLRFLPAGAEIEDALACGADVVVQSSHKTLTALSQCAMMHISHGALFAGGVGAGEAGRLLHQCFSTTTTTSPNALLLASLDAARAQMSDGGGGVEALAQTCAALNGLRAELRAAGLLLMDDVAVVSSVDPLRLTVSFPHAPDATTVDDWLCDEHGLFCELNLPKCITYVIPPGATDQDLADLRRGLLAAAHKWRGGQELGVVESNKLAATAAAAASTKNVCSRDAALVDADDFVVFIDSGPALDGCDTEAVHLGQLAVGRVCAETVCVYPPGIPIAIQGQSIDAKLIDKIQQLASQGLASGRTVTGATDASLSSLLVYRLE